MAGSPRKDDARPVRRTSQMTETATRPRRIWLQTSPILAGRSAVFRAVQRGVVDGLYLSYDMVGMRVVKYRRRPARPSRLTSRSEEELNLAACDGSTPLLLAAGAGHAACVQVS